MALRAWEDVLLESTWSPLRYLSYNDCPDLRSMGRALLASKLLAGLNYEEEHEWMEAETVSPTLTAYVPTGGINPVVSNIDGVHRRFLTVAAYYEWVDRWMLDKAERERAVLLQLLQPEDWRWSDGDTAYGSDSD